MPLYYFYFLITAGMNCEIEIGELFNIDCPVCINCNGNNIKILQCPYNQITAHFVGDMKLSFDLMIMVIVFF